MTLSNGSDDQLQLGEVRKPRICMPSGRNFKKKTFLCGHYEAQDVLCEVDQVDLVCLDAEPGYQFKESWQRRLLYRDVSRRLIFQSPGLRKVQLTKEYDLFLALCQTHHDFLHINAIRGWKDHCKTSVCWIDFYLHDTFGGSLSDVYDYKQHRHLFSNVTKRSRYFMVAPGKVDVSDETKGQVEIGHRYYEGAAAGAVMIGQAPNCDAFGEMFPWPDAVVEVKPDGSDVIDVVNRIESLPGLAFAISQRNAAEALLRHDWGYRWKQILQVAGLQPLPAMDVREQRLKQLAAIPLSTVESKNVAGSIP